jgi:hypothetical protein
MKSYIGILFLSFLITPTLAFPQKLEFWDRSEGRPLKNKFVPEIVTWIGQVKEEASSHATEHDLKFIMLSGKKYDIVDSPDIVKFRHETNKNYLVEIEAEKTPTFLFWGGKLVVKKFKIISESSLRRKSTQQGLI